MILLKPFVYYKAQRVKHSKKKMIVQRKEIDTHDTTHHSSIYFLRERGNKLNLNSV